MSVQNRPRSAPPVELEAAAVPPDAEGFRPRVADVASEQAEGEASRLWGLAGRRLRRDPRAWFGGLVALCMVLAAALGPWLWPRDRSEERRVGRGGRGRGAGGEAEEGEEDGDE